MEERHFIFQTGGRLEIALLLLSKLHALQKKRPVGDTGRVEIHTYDMMERDFVYMTGGRLEISPTPFAEEEHAWFGRAR